MRVGHSDGVVDSVRKSTTALSRKSNVGPLGDRILERAPTPVPTPSDPAPWPDVVISRKVEEGEPCSERAREWRASHTNLGGEKTRFVHATDYSLKATSVMIASAGL